jgi:hypothetical protein
VLATNDDYSYPEPGSGRETNGYGHFLTDKHLDDAASAITLSAVDADWLHTQLTLTF